MTMMITTNQNRTDQCIIFNTNISHHNLQCINSCRLTINMIGFHNSNYIRVCHQLYMEAGRENERSFLILNCSKYWPKNCKIETIQINNNFDIYAFFKSISKGNYFSIYWLFKDPQFYLLALRTMNCECLANLKWVIINVQIKFTIDTKDNT